MRHHLLMSSTAFKRDLADPKTIDDFVHQVQSPERLRLLLVLTVVDIRGNRVRLGLTAPPAVLIQRAELSKEAEGLGAPAGGRPVTLEAEP